MVEGLLLDQWGLQSSCLHHRKVRKSHGLGILLLVLLLTVISFVLLAAVAGAVMLAQRGRRREKGWIPAPPVPGFRQHVFAAAEHDVKRTPREVAAQTIESIGVKKTWDAPLETKEEMMVSHRKPPAKVRREELSGNSGARRMSL